MTFKKLKIVNLGETLNSVNSYIKNVEEALIDASACIPVDYELLSWRRSGDRFRICFKETPLADHCATVRLGQVKNIEGLVSVINANHQAIIEKFKGS